MKKKQTQYLISAMVDVQRKLAEAQETHWFNCMTTAPFELFEADIGVSARDDLLNQSLLKALQRQRMQSV